MDCCADICFLSVRFARSMAAAICRFSSRVSLRFSFDNGLNLLVQLFLPLKGGIETAFENKKQRYADERSAAKADQLPLG